MNIEKITELYSQANIFINKCFGMKNECINNIKEQINNLNTITNNPSKYSDKYIKEKKNITEKKIEKTISGFNKRIEDLTNDIKIWYNNQMTILKCNIVRSNQAKLGINLPDEAINSLANAIPHPELSLPEFKIDISDFMNPSGLNI